MESVPLQMPKEYQKNPLVSRLITMIDDEHFMDVKIVLGSFGATKRANSTLLSLLSPVWQRQLSKDTTEKVLNFGDDDAKHWQNLLNLSCGLDANVSSAREILELAITAEKYEMEYVRDFLEDRAIDNLTLETCWDGIRRHRFTGTPDSRFGKYFRASVALALTKFEEFCCSDGFLQLTEEELASLLRSDHLQASSEEKIFEGVCRWIQSNESRVGNGQRLLILIRFPLMEAAYLWKISQSSPISNYALTPLVFEAFFVKRLDYNATSSFNFQSLQLQAVTWRIPQVNHRYILDEIIVRDSFFVPQAKYKFSDDSGGLTFSEESTTATLDPSLNEFNLKIEPLVSFSRSYIEFRFRHTSKEASWKVGIKFGEDARDYNKYFYNSQDRKVSRGYMAREATGIQPHEDDVMGVLVDHGSVYFLVKGTPIFNKPIWYMPVDSEAWDSARFFVELNRPSGSRPGCLSVSIVKEARVFPWQSKVGQAE